MEDEGDKNNYRIKHGFGLFFGAVGTIGLLAIMANFWAEEPWFGWFFLAMCILFVLLLLHYFYLSWFK
jgi:hypothetical protein